MTHDPMLNGITRYRTTITYAEVPSEDGRFVLFSDLPALLAKVREDAVRDYAEAHYANKMQRGEERYEQGRADAARDVAALPCDSYSITVSRQTVLAAARGGTDDD